MLWPYAPTGAKSNDDEDDEEGEEECFHWLVYEHTKPPCILHVAKCNLG